jgi:hypothetical protein
MWPGKTADLCMKLSRVKIIVAFDGCCLFGIGVQRCMIMILNKYLGVSKTL